MSNELLASTVKCITELLNTTVNGVVLFIEFCEISKNTVQFRPVALVYLAKQEYNEEEKNYSDTDGQDDSPKWHSGRLLYTNVRECTSSRLQVTTAHQI